MAMFTVEKALRSMRKTPVILQHVLRGLTTEQARAATDGPDGWSVLEVMCHLYDFEEIYYTRARRIISENKPEFPGYDNHELARLHDYLNQDIEDMFQRYAHLRREFITMLIPLREDEWQRRGLHPESGVVTLLEHVTNVSLHDLNHIEQIIRALEPDSLRL